MFAMRQVHCLFNQYFEFFVRAPRPSDKISNLTTLGDITNAASRHH